jgi:hypothetical protein
MNKKPLAGLQCPSGVLPCVAQFEFSLLSLLALVALLSGSPARADTVTLSFPGTGTYWFSQPAAPGVANSGYIPPGGGSTNWMWATGAYLSETFTGVGLYSVSSVQLSYSINDAYLNGYETWDIYLNGQFLGSDTLYGSYCDCGGQYIFGDAYTFTDSFAPIVGNGTYTLEFYLAQGVAPGDGSIAFNDGGLANLTGDPFAVPSPIAGAWPSRPDLRERWPSRLVATAAEGA